MQVCRGQSQAVIRPVCRDRRGWVPCGGSAVPQTEERSRPSSVLPACKGLGTPSRSSVHCPLGPLTRQTPARAPRPLAPRWPCCVSPGARACPAESGAPGELSAAGSAPAQGGVLWCKHRSGASLKARVTAAAFIFTRALSRDISRHMYVCARGCTFFFLNKGLFCKTKLMK